MFHTFNELYLADKQIILSSDRPPKEIKIEERLKTRFATGVIADIQPPDLETRIAILQKKCNAKGYSLNIKVLSLIAEKITNNIREMEGMLNRIISYSTLVGGDPNDMGIVNDALRDYADASSDIITIDHVVSATCEYFRVKREDLIGKKEKQRNRRTQTNLHLPYMRYFRTKRSARFYRRVFRRTRPYNGYARA